MAVVQISKIQVRRGRKLAESGVPQLASGELAWTVDTQELYIGNGSVTEGAPAVGNTKVLTEKDNLFDVLGAYQFAAFDSSFLGSKERSPLDKLDEYVSILDFGAVGDGATDNTAALQAAVDGLYSNADTGYRKRIMVPVGEYIVEGELVIPSNVVLEGESQERSIIHVTTGTITTKSEAGTLPALFESTDRSQNIRIRNITINIDDIGLDITGLKDSTFDSVTFKGPYESLNAVAALTTGEPLLKYTNGNKIGIRVDNIAFNDCVFQGAYTAVYFNQTNPFESNIKFHNTTFQQLKRGIHGVGQDTQKNNWIVSDCYFNEIAHRAIWMESGVGTKVLNSRFINCGNDVNQASNPEVSIIFFEEKGNNIVAECSFNRHQAAYTENLLSLDQMVFPEVLNAGAVTINDQNTARLYVQGAFTPLTMFSTLNRVTFIDYTVAFTSGSGRSGRITITVGNDLMNPVITDSYSSSAGDANAENLEFTVDLVDKNDSTVGSETMVLSYKNPNAGVSPDIMTYFVSYGV